MKRKSSRGGAEFLLLFASIIVCLFLLEGGLRVKSFLHNTVLYAPNLEFETFDVLNADGFRGTRISPESTSGHRNIFVIGDSFMYGVGVSAEHSVPSRLQEFLSRETCPVSVFNLGIPGAAPSTYAQTAARYRQYAPDVVIVGLYLGNDIQTKESPAAPQPMSIGKKLRSLIGNSATVKSVSALVRGIRGTLFHECLAARDTGVDILSYHLPKNLEDAMCDGRMNPHLLSRGAVGDNDAYFQELAHRFSDDATTKDKLLEIRDTFPSSTFLLLVIPSKYQVSTAYQEPMKQLGFVFAHHRAVSRDLQNAVLAWAKSQKIDAMDLLPLMANQERRTGTRLFYHYDEHPNEQGAKFMTDVLARRLQETDICAQ